MAFRHNSLFVPDDLPILNDGGSGGGGAVDSVNGMTGAVIFNKAGLGLALVDNTADLDKPISTDTQAALDDKEDAFTKLTAFNKDFTVSGAGTNGVATTVARGDHDHDFTFKGAWDLATTYKAGDYAEEGDSLYRANSAIASNTPFAEGTAVNEWTYIGKSFDLLETAFITPTDISAAIWAEPSQAEILAYVLGNGITNKILKYNGTGVDNTDIHDEYVYEYLVDGLGDVTVIERAGYVSKRYHIRHDSLGPALVDEFNPTVAEMQTYVTTAGLTDAIIYYTGDDNDTSQARYVYHADATGLVIEIAKPAAEANIRVFADDTTVAPALVGEPTVAEIKALVTSLVILDTVVYYTGTDLGTDDVTYAYHVDVNGDVTEIQKPGYESQARHHIMSTDLVTVDGTDPTIDEITTYAATEGITDRIMFHNNAPFESPFAPELAAYHVDIDGKVTLLWRKKDNEIERIFMPVDKVTAGKYNNPTISDVTGYCILQSFTNGFVTFNGTLVDDNIATNTYFVDIDGTVTEISDSPSTIFLKKGTEYIGNSLTAGELAGLGEKNAFYCANGTTVDDGIYTHIYFVDAFGVRFTIKEPTSNMPRQFVSATALLPVDINSITQAEIEAYVLANALEDVLVYFTGTDTSTDEPTFVWNVDIAGETTLIEKPTIGARKQLHITATQVPLSADGTIDNVAMLAYIAANVITGVTAFYTGTDVTTDAALISYDIDENGDVVVLGKEVHSFFLEASLNTFSADVAEPTKQDFIDTMNVLGLTNAEELKYRNVFVKYNGTDIDNDAYTYIWFIDMFGNVDLIKEPSTTAKPQVHVTATDVALDTGYGAEGVFDLAAIETYITTNTIENSLVYYTGTDTATDPVIASFDVDEVGNVKVLGTGVGTMFLKLSEVANIELPTNAEVMTALSSRLDKQEARNVLVKFNQTDTDDGEYTHMWFVDYSGNIALIDSPQLSTPRLHLDTAVPAFATVHADYPATYDGFLYANNNDIKDTFMFYTNSANANDRPVAVYYVDSEGSSTLIESNYEYPRYFVDVLDIVCAEAGNPTTAEMQSHYDISISAKYELVYYNGTSDDSIDPTHVWDVDGDLILTLIEKPGAVALDRIFIDETTLVPATSGLPTDAEFEAFITADGTKDAMYIYNGTNTVSNTPTYVHYVDASGNITLIERPFSNARVHLTSTNMGGVTTPWLSTADVQAQADYYSYTNCILFWTGTNDPDDLHYCTFDVDNDGKVTRTQSPTSGIYFMNHNAVPSDPTIADIKAEMDYIISVDTDDEIIYTTTFITYNDTGNPSIEPTSVYVRDTATGEITQIQKPSSLCQDRVHADAATYGAFGYVVTVDNLQPAVTAQGLKNTTIYYTGTNDPTDRIYATYNVDNSGNLVETERVRLSPYWITSAHALIADPVAGPTMDEVKAIIAADGRLDHRALIVRYNGTADGTNQDWTHIWLKDEFSGYTVLKEPTTGSANDVLVLTNTDLSAADSLGIYVTQAEVEAYVATNSVTDTLIHYASADPTGRVYSAWDVDASGNVTLIERENIMPFWIDEALLAPAISGHPTDAEINAYLTTFPQLAGKELMIRYTGLGTGFGSPITHTWFRDAWNSFVTPMVTPRYTKKYTTDIAAADINDRVTYLLDTSAAAFNVVLPDPTELFEGYTVTFLDTGLSLSTNNVSVSVDGGGTIDGVATPYLLDVDTAEMIATVVNGAWEMYATGFSGATESGGGSLDYLTTEQATGQLWIDGKEIYQNTIDFSVNNFTNGDTFATGVETIIDSTGYATINGFQGRALPFQFLDGGLFTDVGFHVRLVGTNLNGIGLGNAASINNGHLTIKYTKV